MCLVHDVHEAVASDDEATTTAKRAIALQDFAMRVDELLLQFVVRCVTRCKLTVSACACVMRCACVHGQL